MQKSNRKTVSSRSAHRVTQKSTTLNRKYVKRPQPKKITIKDDEEKKINPIIDPEVKISATTLEDAIVEAKEISDEVLDQEVIEDSYPANNLDEAISLENTISHAKISHFAPAPKQIVKAEPKHRILVSDDSENSAKKAEKKISVSDNTDALESVQKAAKEAAKKALEESKKAEEKKIADEKAKAEREKEALKVAKEETKKAVNTVESQKKKEEKPAQKSIKSSAEKKSFSVSRKKKIKESKKQIIRQEVKQPEPKVKKMRDVSKKKSSEPVIRHRRGGGGRVLLGLVASAACMAILGGVVYVSIPDVSVKVTAMQSGIEAKYPSYVPRDFSLETVYVDGDGAVVMEFGGPSGQKFSITESESSWDSNALLNNYVKKTWNSDDYTALRESGITIYISNSSAVWVNGGMFYKISAANGVLSKKQIKNIVTSI